MSDDRDLGCAIDEFLFQTLTNGRNPSSVSFYSRPVIRAELSYVRRLALTPALAAPELGQGPEGPARSLSGHAQLGVGDITLSCKGPLSIAPRGDRVSARAWGHQSRAPQGGKPCWVSGWRRHTHR